jgi:hypothetical protein
MLKKFAVVFFLLLGRISLADSGQRVEIPVSVVDQIEINTVCELERVPNVGMKIKEQFYQIIGWNRDIYGETHVSWFFPVAKKLKVYLLDYASNKVITLGETDERCFGSVNTFYIKDYKNNVYRVYIDGNLVYAYSIITTHTTYDPEFLDRSYLETSSRSGFILYNSQIFDPYYRMRD